MVDRIAPDIGILIYPGAQMAAVLGLTDLLLVAARLAKAKGGGQPALKVSHWQKGVEPALPRRVFTSDTKPAPDIGKDDDNRPQFLVLPPSLEDPIDRDIARGYAPWLVDLHRAGTLLASVCGGALVLGETGLLDGRPATTHWSYRDLICTRFPAVKPDIDRLIIDDGDIITAGGVMAWTDLGLMLIARILGPTIMMETARLMLIDPPGRQQRFYSGFAPNLTHGDAAVLKLQHWLQAHGAKIGDLAALARAAGLEQRTLIRRFRQATGLTTTEYIQRLRIARAQDQLQFSATPVERIAWEVGYDDASAFRRIFRRIVGLSPVEYRQRFRVT